MAVLRYARRGRPCVPQLGKGSVTNRRKPGAATISGSAESEGRLKVAGGGTLDWVREPRNRRFGARSFRCADSRPGPTRPVGCQPDEVVVSAGAGPGRPSTIARPGAHVPADQARPLSCGADTADSNRGVCDSMRLKYISHLPGGIRGFGQTLSRGAAPGYAPYRKGVPLPVTRVAASPVSELLEGQSCEITLTACSTSALHSRHSECPRSYSLLCWQRRIILRKL
jgi:hypothetical protein